MSTVPSIALKGIDILIRELGGDPEELMAQSGLPVSILENPDIPVQGQAFNDLMEHAARQLNQRFFGLQLAKIQGASVLGPLWFLLRHSSNVKEVIDNLLGNYSSHTESTFFTTESVPGGIHFIYDVSPHTRGDHTQVIELGLGIASHFIRRYALPGWQPRAVYLEGPEPYDKRPLEELFGPNLFFDQERNGVFLADEELALPIRGASQLKNRHYQQEVDKRKDFDSRSALVQTETVISASLLKHRCSLTQVARTLNLPPRTLQYQLQKEGTSFRQLVENAKKDLALRYLEHSHLSISDIAQRLQFSEIAVFSRFVKKHTGTSPRAYRQRFSRRY